MLIHKILRLDVGNAFTIFNGIQILHRCRIYDKGLKLTNGFLQIF